MKRFVTVAVVMLACTAAVNAYTLQIQGDVLPEPNQALNIYISGAETNVNALAVGATLPSTFPPTARFTGASAKSGTILSGSNNPEDPPVMTADNTLWSDYSLAFGQPGVALTVGPQLGRTLIADLSGVPVGTYELAMNNDVFGNTYLGFADGTTAEFTGTLVFRVVPEPAAALLLGLGGLFLRRRSA